MFWSRKVRQAILFWDFYRSQRYKPLRPHKPSKTHRPCRSSMQQRSFRVTGGADWAANPRRFRGYHSETSSRCSSSEGSLSEFEASTDYILQQPQKLQELQQLDSIPPVDSCYELHGSVPGLTAALDHVQYQRKMWKLQRRTLMENAREAIGLQCACWWSRYTPNLRALCIESSLDYLLRPLTAEQRPATDPEPGVMAYIRELVNICRKIIKAADSVLSDGWYINTSPCLDVLNINELIPDLNGALIQYLLRIEELAPSNSF
ncbi:uncharacterized protein LOC117586345 isoform X1 [Drosophila guanche]|uniref:Uncharacterized protein n=1 Tax=Drosophila guanche TaxID=7266 RepID=A0A3B0JNJ7_DROGU|nr:uncharacterized protein LOC117586345 isoform X1 [Drosophila guanche]SPP83715.1 Hypothetical predicted protein [Drosophila guanche]